MSLKIGYLYSKDSQLGAGALAFADEVATRTGGRCAIDQYPNAALGGELEMLEALRSGEIDLAFITGAPITSVIPEHGIFDIPFLFRDATHAHAVLDSPIGRGYLEMFGRKQVVALAWGENGMRHLTNSLRPVHSPKDIQGLRLRVPQSEIMVKSFEALGRTRSSSPSLRSTAPWRRAGLTGRRIRSPRSNLPSSPACRST